LPPRLFYKLSRWHTLPPEASLVCQLADAEKRENEKRNWAPPKTRSRNKFLNDPVSKSILKEEPSLKLAVTPFSPEICFFTTVS